MVTLRGEVKVERDYYHCEWCKRGYVPLDQQSELNETAYSRHMGNKMVWLSSLLPYAQCSAVFQEIGERLVPASSLWRQTQQHGQRMQA